MKKVFITIINFGIGALIIGLLLIIKRDPTGVEINSIGSLCTFLFAILFFHKGLKPYEKYRRAVREVKLSFREEGE